MPVQADDINSCLQADLREAGLGWKTGLFPGMTIEDVYATQISTSLTKKLVEATSPDADTKALLKFLEANRRCEVWSLPELTFRTETLVGEFKRAIDEFWFVEGYDLVDSPLDVLAYAKMGPGSNVGSYGGDFYTKLFASPLTCSNPLLYEWYRRYIQTFPRWASAEENRVAHFGIPGVGVNSRLSFVPKNVEISRCICTEPSLNTFFQLGLGQILEKRLRWRFGISLADQQFVNRDLARLGSITGGLVTLDLASASDSISTKMLRHFLPPMFYKMLERFRSPRVDIKGLGAFELDLFASMGNGFTFPLQTVLFACAVVACFRFRGKPFNRSDSESLWGVNGDDIIVPSFIARDVVDLLALLGFSVNDDKSFVEGPFRESCGADFYNGVDVRPPFIKSLLDPQSRIAAINQLIRFSTKSGIWLRRTIGLLLKTVPRVYVPPWSDMSAGLHVPPSMAPKERDVDTQAIVYREFVRRNPKVRVLEERITVPKGNRQRIFNPDGLLISFLQGSVNSHVIGTRYGVSKWELKRRVTSGWAVHGMAARDHQDYGLAWRRWNSVASHYLNVV